MLKPDNLARWLSWLLLGLGCCASALAKTAVPNPVSWPAEISFKQKDLFPEGVAYDPVRQGFWLSSIGEGSLGFLDAQGRYMTHIRHPALVSSFGMKWDAAHGWLVVCVSDPGFGRKTNAKTQKQLAKVLAFDVAKRRLVKTWDLSGLVVGPHFVNDVALAADGSMYVSDSFQPVIYRISAQGEASVWVQDPQLAGEGVAGNGLVVLPNGDVLWAKYGAGELYRIRSSDRQVQRVQLPEAFKGADGMWLWGQDVVLAQNVGSPRVLRLRSNDGWQSAQIQASLSQGLAFPTTLTEAQGRLFVLNAHLDAMIAGQSQTEYSVLQLPWSLE